LGILELLKKVKGKGIKMIKLKKVHVDAYGSSDEFRFHFDVFINPNTNAVEKKVRARAKEEIARIKEHFKKNSYGCSFGKVKYLRFEKTSIKF